MKTNAIVRIVLFSLAIFLLLGVLGVGLGVTSYMVDFSGESGKTAINSFDAVTVTPSPADMESHSFSFEPARIREIEIEWASGSITIEPSDAVTEILIGESAVEEKYAMVCKQSEQTLSIRFCKDSVKLSGFGVTIPDKDLVITVPAGWVCDSLEIDAASADVRINDMNIRELDFNGASGKCDLTRCQVGSLDLDAASGNVTFSGCLDRLDFDGASADCTLVLTDCPSHIDMEGMSGNLDITLPSDCGFVVNTEGLSAEFTTDFATTTRNGAHHYGDGSCCIEIAALSGKICIRDGGYNCQSSSHSHHAGEQEHHTDHH